jgi:molybdenum cofactor biosynthesis enzyme MoaA
MTIRLTALRELWLHTGTACNLSCTFCHEAAAPGDARIGALDVADTLRLLDAASAAGFERFAFTGGEPLILRGIVDILRHALSLRPCLVLTNGTAPLIRRPQHLALLAAGAHPLEFRVSLDHPDEARHDAERGFRMFRKALQGLKLLHEAGFPVSIARLHERGEDPVAIESRFRSLLRRQGLPDSIRIHALPALGRPGDAAQDPDAVAGDQSRTAPACARSRMAARIDGALGFLPCPLVDDDPTMTLGTDLGAAVAAEVVQRHPRCDVCRAQGVDYAGAA